MNTVEFTILEIGPIKVVSLGKFPITVAACSFSTKYRVMQKTACRRGVYNTRESSQWYIIGVKCQHSSGCSLFTKNAKCQSFDLFACGSCSTNIVNITLS